MGRLHLSNLYATLLWDIRVFLRREWTMVLGHTFPEGNRCSDLLVKMGASGDDIVKEMVSPPSGLDALL